MLKEKLSVFCCSSRYRTREKIEKGKAVYDMAKKQNKQCSVNQSYRTCRELINQFIKVLCIVLSIGK